MILNKHLKNGPKEKGHKNDSYFPIEQQVMLNFQVYNLNETIKHLVHIGVPLVKKKEISEFWKVYLD